MPLPKLSVPEYELNLPSNGQLVKYRPFLVKEEKVLMIAMETGDEKSMITAVKSIIKNCTNLKQKVEELPTFDIEYVFLKLRAKSVGESVDIRVTCTDDNETMVDHTVDLSKVEVIKPEDHSTTIDLGDNIGMIMKYPSLDVFVKNNFGDGANEIDTIFELTIGCVDKVYEGDEVWEAKDVSKKELTEFLEGMNTDQFQKVQMFFETMPKLSHTIKVTNPNTGVESDIVLEGLGAFFG